MAYTYATASSGAINFAQAKNQELTLAANTTLTFTGAEKGEVLFLKLIQDATGSRLISAWPASVKWSGGTAPTLTTTASKTDVFKFFYDGTNFYGQTYGLNY